MAPQNRFIVTLTISLFIYLLISPSPSMVAASPALTEKVCKGASILDHALCLQTLSTSQAAAAKGPKQLANSIMKLAAANAETTLNVITGMSRNPNSPAGLKALKTCEDVYRYAVRSFAMIPQELSEDAMTANYDVSVIGPEADKCVNALETANIQAPKISDGNKLLKLYSSMGAEVTGEMNK